MLAAVALGCATSASSAQAGWSAAVQIGGAGDGSSPVLAFGPTGSTAVASTDDAGAPFLVRRPAHGAFSAPVAIASPNSFAPQQVLLPAGGTTVLLVGGAPWYALVQPASAAAGGTFGTPQQLAPADESQALPTNATMIATAKGDVIAVLDGDAATVGGYTTVLPRGATAFGARGPGPGPDNPQQFAAAVDGAGGAFLAWPGICGSGPCVSYRRAAGRFVSLKGLSRPPGCRFNCIDAVGLDAGGDGYDALGEVYGLNRAGAPAGRVAVQVGRRDRLGRARVLASTSFLANTHLVPTSPQGATMNPTGPIVDGRGNVTVAWGTCGARHLGCSIAAASGDVHGGFGPSKTLATTPRVATIAIRALVGDGDVAIQRCAPKRRCSISVAFAGPHRRFGRPQRVTAGAEQLELLVGDARGNQLLVWKGSDAREYAATSRAGSRRFSPPHPLSAPGAMVDHVAGGFGPRGEAIVTWTVPDARALFAATFARPSG